MPPKVAGMRAPAPAPDATAVITGASSGIGREIARELARRGYGVTLVARSAAALDELAGELRAAGVRAEALPADLAQRDERAALPGRIAELGLIPDILVNNAGLSTLGPVAQADVDAELNMIEVDVAAVVDLCTRLVRGMLERGRGAVLNVASTAAFQPLPGQAGYAAAKAFVLSYTHALAGEVAGRGVSVTALCPGPVETGFGETAGFTREEAEASLPPVMWVPVADVARAAVDGLLAGRRVVIPGAANRAVSLFAWLTPRRLLVPIVAAKHPGLRRR